eukprot:COSAG01_NODE_2774_length_7098_cov_13.905571_6_plen_177_part_00
MASSPALPSPEPARAGRPAPPRPPPRPPGARRRATFARAAQPGQSQQLPPPPADVAPRPSSPRVAVMPAKLQPIAWQPYLPHRSNLRRQCTHTPPPHPTACWQLRKRSAVEKSHRGPSSSRTRPASSERGGSRSGPSWLLGVCVSHDPAADPAAVCAPKPADGMAMCSNTSGQTVT